MDIAFYVKKNCNTWHSCHNFPAGSRQAAGGTGIYETSLLGDVKSSPHFVQQLGTLNCLYI